MLAYPIGNALYLNITNRCTNKCIFCVRNLKPGVAGYDLWLDEDPSSEEVIEYIGSPSNYEEVVFCGYGEPLIRLEVVKKVSEYIKLHDVPVRVDTNGLANLYHGWNILPELEGLIDYISISLNAENAQKYNEICRPCFGVKSYEYLLDFIKESKKYIPHVRLTVVDLPEVDISKCREIAKKFEVGLHIRNYSGSTYPEKRR